MNHKKIQEKLSAFREGELEGRERQEIAGHLSQCGECRLRLEQWGRIRAVLSQAAVTGDGENFVEQTMVRLQALDREAAPAFRVSFQLPKWLYPAVGYAFALMMVFVAIIAREPILNVEANTETVLLSDVPQDAQWTFSGETPGINELFEVKEGV